MNKFTLIVSLAIAFAVVGYLSLNSTSYMTVSDLDKIDKPTKVVVMGNVSKGSVFFDKGVLRFVINDGRSSAKVIYHGWIRLDNVSGYEVVAVKGVYYPMNKTIVAEKVLAKCPSKEEISH